ncbi:MAG: ABC transporter transmembrane domain-containing protein, partial [bacterium]
MSLLRLLRAALRPYRPQLLGVVVFQLVATMASLFLPSLNADIIDLGVTRGDTGYITRSGLTMLVVALVQIGGTATAVYFGARTAMGVGRDLRSAVFRQVGTFSSREVAHFGAPSLITRCTNDVQQVQMVVLMACTMMASAPIMMTGGVAMAVREDAGLSWLLMVAVPAMVLSLGFVI